MALYLLRAVRHRPRDVPALPGRRSDPAQGSAGSIYRVDPAKIDPGHAGVDLVQLLADIQDERAERKRVHGNRAG
jgi:hypothetical protein